MRCLLPFFLLATGLVGVNAAGLTKAGDLERRVFNAVNAERRARGRTPLRWDDKLARLARSHSERMASARFFSHVDPVRGDLEERMQGARIDYTSSGENIYTSKGKANPAEAAVEQWLRSPAHRDNLLDSGFTHSAVGVAISKDGHFYATQLFAAYQ